MKNFAEMSPVKPSIPSIKLMALTITRKTNIVDAIRWVLGEQKHSILRSGKKEDIIFNGAKNIKCTSGIQWCTSMK